MEKPSRRNWLQGAALAGLAGLEAARPAAAAPRPNPDTGSHWQRPATQQGNNLNLILLVADTFRADNLAAYGSQFVDCPNLNRLAEQSILFEEAYPEGMPTIPTRRALYTGRRIVPTYHFYQHEPVQLPGWHPLYNEDVTLAETLHEAGYLTALIADVPHLQRPGRNFHRGYYYYEWSRGQEIDYYGQASRKQPDFSDLYPDAYLAEAEKKRPGLREFLNQYQANRKRWLRLGNSIVEQTSRNALRWIDENYAQGPFFLHVESFDPHEPWDPPEEFLHKYLKSPTAHSWPEPPSESRGLPEEGVTRLRANYAGEASNVDHWYGQILEKLGNFGLLDNSVIVFVSDHGTMLNEQGQWLKGPEKLRKQVTHVPLLVRLPGGAHGGKRVSSFVQLPDVMPTVLGLLGLTSPSRVTGTDLMSLATGDGRGAPRDSVVSAFGYIAAVRTPEWNYSAIWNKEKYVGQYKPQLYHRKTDPEELKDVAEDHPAVVKELQSQLDSYISSGWEITSGSFNEKAD